MVGIESEDWDPMRIEEIRARLVTIENLVRGGRVVSASAEDEEAAKNFRSAEARKEAWDLYESFIEDCGDPMRWRIVKGEPSLAEKAREVMRVREVLGS